MDRLNELVFLLPDYELEGFPRALERESAARLLSGWVALWHPTLLCGVARIPRWHQASRLPGELGNTLFVLPPIAADTIKTDGRQQIEMAGGLLMEPKASWKEFQAELLSRLPQVKPNQLASELSAQFAALGYAYLQVQLMTRQVRYTSNLDVALFEEQVTKAAEAAVADDRDSALGMLQACFDTLGQERDHYYSNDAHLIDLTLLVDTTLGKSLEKQLENSLPTNLIASAKLLKKLQAKSPDNLTRIQQRLADASLCIAGGLEHENPTPLQPRDSSVRALQRAPAAYRGLGIEPPKVFARLSYGLQEDSASLLRRFDFQGAILIAFQGGQYPEGNQPKISWEASDGSRLPALACQALDAADPASFLALGWLLGEALDRQHVPTVVLAHWPGAGCEFYELLQIVAAHTPALGKWQLVSDYFANTDNAFHHQRLEGQSFVYNWLAETDSPGEMIIATKRTHKLQTRARSLLNIGNLVWQLENLRNSTTWEKDERGDLVPPKYNAVLLEHWHPRLVPLLAGLDQLLEVQGDSTLRYQQLQALASEISQQDLADLSKQLVKGRGQGNCRLVFNPYSNPTRSWVKTASEETLDDSESWHFASGQVGQVRATCIDLPSMGFVVARLGHQEKSRLDSPMLADAAGLLRNEFTEAQIDLQKGHLRSLHVPEKRGNRLSVRVAYREKIGAKLEYSEMVAHEVSLLTSSNMSGIIRSRGHLQWQGKSAGEFQIDYEIRRGSRIVAATINLEGLQFSDEKNPWRSAFVLRYAWPTEAAILRVLSDGHRSPWGGAKALAPELIEIDESDYRTHILTGGLAFHYRSDFRMAETLLAAHGQTSVRHRVGFAVDLPYPLASARQFMDKPYEASMQTDPTATSGWLLTVDVKNVHVDLECPLVDGSGRNVGLRMKVTESGGKSTTARLRVLRDCAQAHRVDYLGNKLTRLTANADTVTIALRPNEQALVDVLWKVDEAVLGNG